MRYRFVVIALATFGALQCTDINEPQPVLTLSSSSASFLGIAGATDPAAASITLGNGGGGTISGITLSVTYAPGQATGWLQATLSGTSAPATLSLRPTLGPLAPGSYAATVSLDATGAGNGPLTVPVTLIVQAGGTTTLSVTALPLAAVQGVGVPDSATVSITNGGTGALRDLTVRVNYRIGPGSWLTATLSGTAAPAELKLRPSNTVNPGVHTADVIVESPYAANGAQTVTVTYTVQAALADLVMEEPDTIPMASSVEAGTTLFLPTWSVMNRGTVTSNPVRIGYYLSTDSIFTAADVQLGNDVSTVPLAPGSGRGSTQQITTLPRSLPGGEYWIGVVADVLDETVESNEANNVKRTRFTVTAAPAIGLNHDSLTYRMLAAGADARLDTITITNTGGGTLGPLTWGVNYTPGQPANWLAGLFYPGPSIIEIGLHISANDLLPGVYTGEIQITALGAGISRVIPVKLEILAALAVDPPFVGLTAVEGGPSPAPTALAVTSVRGPLSGLTAGVTYPPGGTTGWLTATLSGTTAPATLTLTPATAALPAGQHHAIVAVSSPEAANSPRSVNVTLTVAPPPPVIVLEPGILPLAAVSGATAPTVGTVAVTNGGGGTLDQLAVQSINYGIGQATTGWLAASLDRTTAPATLTLTATTAALPASQPYSASVIIGSPSAAVTASVSVTLTVTAPPVPPAAPSNLVATTVSLSRIDLSWTDNATTEDGFVIERCTDAGLLSCVDLSGTPANFGQIASLPSNITNYQNTSLTPGTTYVYRVRAANAAGASPYSNQASATATVRGPANLVATPTSVSQISLTWADLASDESGFQVWRCAGPACTTFAQVATLGSNTTAYLDGGLSEATSYSYRVRATAGTITSAFSSTASATTLTATAPPAAPSGLVATVISGNRIDLVWTDNATTEQGFRLERCAGAACTAFAEIGIAGANVVTYQSTSLSGSTAYRFRVRAYNSAGNSAYTAIVTATTLEVPPAPTGLTATVISSGQINLAWTHNSTLETGFRIESCEGAACTNFSSTGTASANASGFNDTGIHSNTTHRYRVAATNANGLSDYTPIVAATTPPLEPPTGLAVTVNSSSRVTLTWTNHAPNWATSQVEIQRCAGAACASFARVTAVDGNVATFVNTGLTPATTYRYRVVATRATIESAPSNIVVASTPALPAAPTSLTASSPTSSTVALVWVDNASTETGFQIERCSGEACTNFASAGSALADAESFTSTGLAGVTTYRFRVRATDGDGTSAYSNIVTVTTLATPGTPLPPTSLVVTAVSSSRIDLTWNNAATNETGYQVERCQGAGCSNFAVVINANAPDVSSFPNTGLLPATSYSYRVRHFNAAGNSAYSNVATAVTPATLAQR